MSIKLLNYQYNVQSNQLLKTRSNVSNSSVVKTIDAKNLSSIKPDNFHSYTNINFKASMHEHLGQGARYLGDKKTKFVITAPFAKSVMVSIFSGDINNKDSISVQRAFLDKKDDKFELVVQNTKPGDKYFYTVTKNDGSISNLYDPRADYLPYDIDDYSDKSNLAEIIDHNAFKWSDQDWIKNKISSNENRNGWGLPSSTIIESIHIGLLGGFKEAKKEIDKIAEAGIADKVRLMPIGEFYGKKNWGYDEVAKYAVENSYGRPEDFKDFVNYAHKNNISVILDVVPNHFGPFGANVHELMPTFADDKDTPWGKVLEFNGKNGKYMRSYMTDMLMNWAVNYHVDGFRFDATHFMYSDTAMKNILKELRTHTKTKDLILYPEDMRMSRAMANSSLPKKVDNSNWGYNAITTFSFYQLLLASATKRPVQGVYQNLHQLEHLYKNSVVISHEQFVVSNQDSTKKEKAVSSKILSLPKPNPDNFLINISNHDEIGNGAGGKRNLLNVLSANVDIFERFENGDWSKAQTMLFDMVKSYISTGEPLSAAEQKTYDCKNPISKELFVEKFQKAFDTNKLIIGAMLMHPCPKEFFMGDDRGELAPLKFFAEMPKSSINPTTGVHYLKEMSYQKGYPVDDTAFEESKLNNPKYNAAWVNEGTSKFTKDFVWYLKNLYAFNSPSFDKLCTYSHLDSNILEVKRYNKNNDQVIAVMNFSPEPKQGFELKTIGDQKVREILNSTDTKYYGDGKYSNKSKEVTNNKDLIIPSNSIVLFEPV